MNSSGDKTVRNRRRSPVSAFVICGNEEENIAECLASVAFCDEIVVVDSFSSDRTVEIARRFTDRVYQRAWTNYRDQKAYAIALTSHEWVFNLDADERVTPELRESILDALERAHSGAQTTAYYVNRLVFHLGRWWNRGGWYPEYRLRLLQKSCVRWGGGEVHEKPFVDGPTGYLSGHLLHFSFRDLESHITKGQRLAALSASEAFRNGKRASSINLLLNPWFRFLKFFFLKRGYREGTAGLLVGLLEGYHTFLKYAFLWEYERLAKETTRVSKLKSERSEIHTMVEAERCGNSGPGANAGDNGGS